MKKDLASIRKDYLLKELNESDIYRSPFIQFSKWLEDAINANVFEPNAMVLATTSKDGKPSARVVLLKDFNEQVFVFFTNYQSRKGVQIEQNPYAAIVFFWPQLERQVRIEGIIEKVTADESDKYFASRPKGSKYSAWVSPQSQIIPDRKYLEDRLKDFQNSKTGESIDRPKYWGGYRLKPYLFEFWQGRSNRLHDRIQFIKKNKKWEIERLAP